MREMEDNTPPSPFRASAISTRTSVASALPSALLYVTHILIYNNAQSSRYHAPILLVGSDDAFR